mgnify:CR=1 FL=1
MGRVSWLVVLAGLAGCGPVVESDSAAGTSGDATGAASEDSGGASTSADASTSASTSPPPTSADSGDSSSGGPHGWCIRNTALPLELERWEAPVVHPSTFDGRRWVSVFGDGETQVFALSGAAPSPVVFTEALRFDGSLLALADIDGDGVRDVVARDQDAELWYPAAGADPQFGPPQPLERPVSRVGAFHASSGDAAADVVVVVYPQDSGDPVRAHSLVGHGDGTFFEAWQTALPEYRDWLQPAAHRDFPELVGLVSEDVCLGFCSTSQYLQLFRVDVDGVATPVFESKASWPGALELVSDLDGDGLPELVTTANLGGGANTRVSVRRSSSDYVDEVVLFEVREAVFDSHVGDFDGDGLDDLLVFPSDGGPLLFAGLDPDRAVSVLGETLEGGRVRSGGNVDDDGRHDLLVTVPAADEKSALVWVTTLDPC